MLNMFISGGVKITILAFTYHLFCNGPLAHAQQCCVNRDCTATQPCLFGYNGCELEILLRDGQVMPPPMPPSPIFTSQVPALGRCVQLPAAFSQITSRCEDRRADGANRFKFLCRGFRCNTVERMLIECFQACHCESSLNSDELPCMAATSTEPTRCLTRRSDKMFFGGGSLITEQDHCYISRDPNGVYHRGCLWNMAAHDRAQNRFDVYHCANDYCNTRDMLSAQAGASHVGTIPTPNPFMPRLETPPPGTEWWRPRPGLPVYVDQQRGQLLYPEVTTPWGMSTAKSLGSTTTTSILWWHPEPGMEESLRTRGEWRELERYTNPTVTILGGINATTTARLFKYVTRKIPIDARKTTPREDISANDGGNGALEVEEEADEDPTTSTRSAMTLLPPISRPRDEEFALKEAIPIMTRSSSFSNRLKFFSKREWHIVLIMLYCSLLQLQIKL